MEKYIKERMDESAWVKIYMARNDTKIIEDVADGIVKIYKKKGKVILMGNGGSASQCEHIAAELVGKYEMSRRSLDAIALTADTSVLTSLANDFGYDKVFEKQIEGIAKKKDIIIGLTTSGNSPNVLRGFEKAKQIGATTVALTGKDGLYNKPIIYEQIRSILEEKAADYLIKVPSDRTSVIQEAHITLLHIVCDLVEKKLFGK